MGLLSILHLRHLPGHDGQKDSKSTATHHLGPFQKKRGNNKHTVLETAMLSCSSPGCPLWAKSPSRGTDMAILLLLPVNLFRNPQGDEKPPDGMGVVFLGDAAPFPRQGLQPQLTPLLTELRNQEEGRAPSSQGLQEGTASRRQIETLELPAKME